MSWEASTFAITLLVGVLAFAAGTAAEAAGDAQVEILHDTGPNGTTHAGTVNTFGWVLLNDDGEPAFHQNTVFEVTFEDKVLLRTTPASGHDYDGIDPYHVAFPGPGNYTVKATTWEGGEALTAEMTGRVLEAPEDDLSIDADVPESATAGEQVEVSYTVRGPDGQAWDGADVQVHLRRASDAFEVFRTTTHAHPGPHTFSYTFDRTGTFELVLVATPSGVEGQPPGAPVSQRYTIEVAEPSTPEPPASAPMVEQPLTNSRETGSENDRYQLFGTYDPYTTVGPYSRIRLGGLVWDTQDGGVAGHVDYEATLTGPDGRELFASSSLHSVDGILEVATSQARVGEYTLDLAANRGGWSDAVTLTFGVVPPAAAANNGALIADLNVTESPAAGEPFTFPIQVDDAAGVPAAHGEVDWRVLDEDDVPVYAGKLHTHENATFPLTVTFPGTGSYTVETLPESLQPTPTPFTYGGEIGNAPVFGVDVADGPGLPTTSEPLDPTSQDETPDNVPGLPALVILVSLVGLARLRQQR